MTNLVSTTVRTFFLLPMSMRPPRVLTRSFPLIPATSTASDSVQLLGFGLFGSLAHRLRPIPGFCSSGQSFALRRTFHPPQSGFLQIPPHDGHPCLRLTLPAVGRVRDFHPIERALAGRTAIKTPQPKLGGFIKAVPEERKRRKEKAPQEKKARSICNIHNIFVCFCM